jgi:membrane-associated phospholipid phosphatase
VWWKRIVNQEERGYGGTILNSGVEFILFLQGLGDWLFGVMEAITFLGSEDFYLLVMPILYWAVDATLGFRVGVVLLMSSSLSTLFKWTFHLPRPYWYDPRVNGMVSEAGFGVPSGHSMTPFAVFGLIAATVKRGWVWAAAGILIFLVGLSRMVLGVHFYLDVLVGWTLGALLLWGFVRFEDQVKEWFVEKSLGAKIGILLAVSIGLILIGALVIAAVSPFEVPADWVANAVEDQPDGEIDPLNLNGLITSAAALFGLGAGYLWINSRGGFDASGVWWKRVLRVLIGLVGVVVFWMGLGAVFPSEPDLISYVLRYLRYGLTGFWMAGASPWVFLRFGLAESQETDN